MEPGHPNPAVLYPLFSCGLGGTQREIKEVEENHPTPVRVYLRMSSSQGHPRSSETLIHNISLSFLDSASNNREHLAALLTEACFVQAKCTYHSAASLKSQVWLSTSEKRHPCCNPGRM